MEVIICKNKEAAELTVAKLMAALLKRKPSSLLGLATGRTMESVYSILIDMHRNDGLDFSLASSVNLDEYVGLPADHDQSYRDYMNEHLFSKVNFKEENTHLPNGMAPNIPEECHIYEQIIKDQGGIDLQLLGIGTDGHIGFNEPGSSLASRTRIKTLTRETVEQNGPIFGDNDMVPRHALTMGVGTIMEAEEVVLLATGTAKAQIIRDAVEGPISSWVTASALQMHPNAVIVVDEDAAKELQNYDYYKWAFDNKPDWQSQF
ncbi:MAG: glucosamine-6-phosphate deaminase [Lentisphaeraceae bacterium]|nr:glucosamine-6-phosphate deaminase [Lentisphaeraceae bacterium]